MLVLTRRVNDTTIFNICGEEVTLKVLSLTAGKVRLGFSAGNNVRIIRKEAKDKGRGDADKKQPVSDS